MSRPFTPAEDRIILDGRAAGLSWSAIGKRVGCSGKACEYRLSRGLGVPDPKPVQVGRSEDRRSYDEPEEKQKRDAMPAGTEASWQAITAGTVLDGSAYR